MSRPAQPQVGDVLVVRLPLHPPGGHEQEGFRPAIVVGWPARLGFPRYPMLIIAPLTTARGQGWASQSPDLYPMLQAGDGGLPVHSLVLMDQLRAVDAGRVVRRLGALDQVVYARLHRALTEVFRP